MRSLPLPLVPPFLVHVCCVRGKMAAPNFGNSVPGTGHPTATLTAPMRRLPLARRAGVAADGRSGLGVDLEGNPRPAWDVAYWLPFSAPYPESLQLPPVDLPTSKPNNIRHFNLGCSLLPPLPSSLPISSASASPTDFSLRSSFSETTESFASSPRATSLGCD